MYALFITVKIVSQSQQMRAKKKKSRKRELINVDAEPKRSQYVLDTKDHRSQRPEVNITLLLQQLASPFTFHFLGRFSILRVKQVRRPSFSI